MQILSLQILCEWIFYQASRATRSPRMLNKFRQLACLAQVLGFHGYFINATVDIYGDFIKDVQLYLALPGALSKRNGASAIAGGDKIGRVFYH